MRVPLELCFRGVRRSRDLEAMIRRKVGKLERFCDHLTGCRVAVERLHTRESGGPYRVRISLTVPPGHELAVHKEPRDPRLSDNVRAVITDAFAAAERQLKELVRRQRSEVKTRVG